MLLATSLTAGCGLFPTVSQFVGEPSANVPCDFGAPVYLKAPAPVTSAAFGTTIAIDGSTLIVVAPEERAGVAPVPESQDPAAGCAHRPDSPLPPSGAIYSFSRYPDSWGSRPIEVEGASMVAGAAAGPSDGPPIIKNDNFTLISVAVNDGWLAVGLAGDAGSSGLRGSVRLFARTTRGFAEMAPPLVEEMSESLGLFGYSVALSGNTLVVGAPGLSPVLGAAYVYDLGQSPPVLEKQLRPASLPDKAVFGAAVAVSDDFVVVGAPGEDGTGLYGGIVGVGAVYVYRRPDLDEARRLTTERSTLPLAFGAGLALDGNLLLVAAPSADGCQGSPGFSVSGVVNPFTFESGDWHERPCIGANDNHAGLFGWSLSLSADKLLVGAPFSWSGDPLKGVPTGMRNPATGAGTSAGRVYVFDRQENAFTSSCFLEAPNPDPCDNFGQSVAIGSGLFAVGAYGEDGLMSGAMPDTENRLMDSGAVYVYPQH